jgi:hypothetical protein
MHRFIFTSLCIILVFTQWAFAGVHVWAYSLMSMGIFALSALVILADMIGHFRPQLTSHRSSLPPSPPPSVRSWITAHPAVPWVILFILLGFVQLAHLPAWAVQWLSPQGYELKTLALEVSASQETGWMQLSMIPYETKIEVIRFVAYACLFFLIIRLTRSKERILAVVFVLVGMGLFQVLYGMAQAYSSVHKIWWYPVQSGQGLVLGTYINANHLSMFLEMVIPLCFGLVFAYWPQETKGNAHGSSPRSVREVGSEPRADGATVRKVRVSSRSSHASGNASSRSGFQRFRNWLAAGVNREQRIMFAFIAMILGLGLFLTSCRGGVLCFFAGTVGMALLFMSRRRFRGFGKMVFVLIGITLAYSLYVGIDVMIDTFTQQGLKNSRLDYTLSALPMLFDYPLLGTGMGTFKEAYLQYAVPYRSGNTILYHLHNDWLEVGVEVGFLGLLTVASGYVWFMAKSVRAWFGRRNHFSIGIGGGAIAALLAVGIHAFGEFGLRMPANALTVLVIAAVGWNALTLERGRGRRKKRTERLERRE